MAWDLTADLPVGVWHRSPGRTVSESDITVLAGLTGAIGPAHVDTLHGADTPARSIVLGGPLVVAYAAGLWRSSTLIRDLRRRGGFRTLTGLGLTVSFRAPVRPGDTIHLESAVAGARITSKDPTRAVLTIDELVVNQHGDVVAEMTRSVLVERV